MLSMREHLAALLVLGALLGIAGGMLARWVKPGWAVAVGLAVLFVPLFVLSHLLGVGGVWVYRRWFEGRAYPDAAGDCGPTVVALAWESAGAAAAKLAVRRRRWGGADGRGRHPEAVRRARRGAGDAARAVRGRPHRRADR